MPDDEIFIIDEVIGVSKKVHDEIVRDIKRLDQTDMDMVEIIGELTKGCDPYDVMVGFKIAVFVFDNEDRLLRKEE